MIIKRNDVSFNFLFFNEGSDVEEVLDNAEVEFEIFVRMSYGGKRLLAVSISWDVCRLVSWWKFQISTVMVQCVVHPYPLFVTTITTAGCVKKFSQV